MNIQTNLGTKNIMIAKCEIKNGKITQYGFYPCIVGKDGKPEVVANDERGRQVFDYMERITQEAELQATFKWVGDEIQVTQS